MASRTQIRLQQLTGSLSAPDALGNQVALASLSAAHLGDLLAEMGQAIARIHGEKDFTNKAAGVFGHASQFESTLQVDGAADLKSSAVISGSAEMKSTLAVDGAATMASTLQVDGNADLNAELDVAQAARMASTLAVTGESTLASATISDLTSGRVVLAGTAGSVEDSANLTFNGTILSAPEASFSTEVVAASAQISDLTSGRVVLAGVSGEIEDSANLTFDGSKLTVTGTQQVTSNMDIDGELDAAQAVNFQSTLAVAGAADLNGSLDVAGAVDLAAAGVLTNIRGTLSVDEAATFDSNVTISGNLTVSGTTTTVNTEEVTIADHNIVLDSNNNLSAIVDGAGFTIEGGTGDDLTFQWSTADADMELKLGTGFAKLHIGDLAAAGAVFSADVSAVSGSFSGDMAVSGDITAASAAISGLVEAGSAQISGALTAGSAQISDLTDNRVVIAGASGELEDDANFTFDGALLNVGVPARAIKFEIDGATNYIDTNEMGMSEIDLVSAAGLIALKKGANLFGAIQDSAGAMALMPAETAHIEILSGSGAEIARFEAAGLQMEGVHKVQFNDANEAIWSSTNELMFKSNGVEYAWPQADAAAADYVLVSDAAGQLSWKSADASAAASAVKHVESLSAAVLAGNDFAFADVTIDLTGLDSKDEKMIDIYVNGQLLYSNKQQVAATYDTSGDYDASINTADGKIRFAFDLEIDDVVTVIGR